jgi:cysteine synthase A
MVYKNISDTIGSTPLVKINRLSDGLDAEILAKLEFFNPLGSVKDRIGRAMIRVAEKSGEINDKTLIVEPTSGNTGIALAFICAQKGYRLILTMPDTMSIERQKLLKHLGAKIILTKGADGMKGAIKEAEAIVEYEKNVYMPNQFKNKANPKIHMDTTAKEIWESTSGKIDIFVAGVGTGGTITGVSTAIKEKKSDFKAYAVEPTDSPVLSGGAPGSHKIQGIGAGFIPEVYDSSVIDGVITVTNEEAIDTSRLLASEEGILCGISSGAAVSAAIKIAKKDNVLGKKIVVILPSTGERYISTDLFK